MSLSPFRKLTVFLLLFMLAFPAPCLAGSVKLDRGVTYLTMTRENSQGRPVVINAVIADLNDSRVEPRLVMAEDKLGRTRTVSGMARDNYALAGINGGFFSTSKRAIPTDTFMLDGRIVSKGMRDPAVFGLFENGKAFIDMFHPTTVVTVAKNFVQYDVEAINHETGIGLILYTPDYGTETGTSNHRVNTPSALCRAGTTLRRSTTAMHPYPVMVMCCHFRVPPATCRDWRSGIRFL